MPSKGAVDGRQSQSIHMTDREQQTVKGIPRFRLRIRSRNDVPCLNGQKPDADMV